MTTTRPRRARPVHRRLISAGLLASLVAASAACSGGSDAAPTTTSAPTTTAPTTTAAPTTTTTTTTTTTLAPTTTAAATTTTEKQYRRMPLTGAVLERGDKGPGRPALVVKIDNVDVRGRQMGLNQADIVFEEIVEGRATRFAAVFHSQGANPVGPIRSGRTQDVDLLSGLRQPLFAWSGGNPGVTAAIDNSDFVPLTHGSAGGYYRDGCCSPHNLYNTTDALWAQMTPAAGRPQPLFRYIDPGERLAGKNASWVEVRIGTNRVRWEWSPEFGVFLRSQNGSAHNLVDGRANAENVVLLMAHYRPSYVDARSPEAITVDKGFAFVYSKGKRQIGVWQRKKNTDPIRLSTPGGKPIEIAPGRTWVELVDADFNELADG